jgi:hypothetical protein
LEAILPKMAAVDTSRQRPENARDEVMAGGDGPMRESSEI